MATIGALIYRIGADTSELVTNTRKIEGTLDKLSAGAVKVGQAIAGAFVLDKVVDGFRAVVGGAIDMNAKLETSTLQFTTLMGSADKARDHVRGLFKFAAETPFETEPIIEASRKLQVFGGEALNTEANLRLVGDAAAATGAPIEDVAFWTGRMYAAMAANKPIGEAIQNLMQLGVVGPQAASALTAVATKAIPVSEKFAVMQKTLGDFTGAMGLQANTWSGLMSSLTDSVNIALAEAFEPLFQGFKDLLKSMVDLVSSQEAKDLTTWLSEKLTTAAKAGATGLKVFPIAIQEIKVAFAKLQLWFAEAILDFAGFGQSVNKAVAAMVGPLMALPGVTGQAATLVFATATQNAQEAKKDFNAATATVNVMKLSVRDAETKLVAMQASLAAAGTTAATTAASGARRFTSEIAATGQAVSATTQKLREMLAVQDRFLAQRGAMALGLGGPQFNAGGGGLALGTDLTSPWGGVARITDAMGWGGTNVTARPDYGGGAWNRIGLAGLSTAMPYLSQWATGGSRAGQLGGSIAGGLGGALGSVGSVTSALGSFAPFLGPVAGLIGGLVGRLFGPSAGAIRGREADARISQTQAGLLQQYGSLEAIAATGRAGQDLVAGWGSKNVAGEQHFNALIAAFEKQNALLDDQKTKQAQILDLEAQRQALVESLIPTAEQLNSITERYGINTEGLGTAYNQIIATDAWSKMANDIEKLNAASADVGGYLVGMSDEMSNLVRQSIKLGTDVPDNLRPYVEELIRSGNYLDENGQKVTDTREQLRLLAQLRWGDAVKTEGDKTREQIGAIDQLLEGLREAVQLIVDALGTKLPEAAVDGVRGINDAISRTPISPIRIPVDVEDPEFPGMATGGVVTRPTLTWIGERGPEAVVPLSQASRYGLGARGDVHVTVNVAGYLDSVAARAHLATVVRQELGSQLRMYR